MTCRDAFEQGLERGGLHDCIDRDNQDGKLSSEQRTDIENKIQNIKAEIREYRCALGFNSDRLSELPVEEPFFGNIYAEDSRSV